MSHPSINAVSRLLLGGIAWLWCDAALCGAHGAFHDELQHLNEQIEASPNDGALLFQRGWTSFLHGDWQACLIDVEKAERLAPDKYPFDYVRGQALALGGKFGAAKTVLDDFIKAHPEHGPATAARARCCDKLGQHDAALADFSAALDKRPEPEPDLYLETAEAFMAQKRQKDAAQVLQTGIQRLGNIPSLTLKALDIETATHQYDLALQRVDAMQKAAPRPEPWMAKRAALLSEAGRAADASNAWTALRDRIAGLPNLERGSNAMSVLAQEAETALAALKSAAAPHAPAVQVTKVDPKALFPSRSVLGPGSNYEEELDRMDVLVLKEPANAQYRFQRGELNFLDGKWKWAAEDCEEAERLAPGKYPVDRLRAQILGGEGKHTEALLLLDKYLAANPNDSVAHTARARIAMMAGQVNDALESYRLALARAATPDSNLFLEAATAFNQHDRRDEAMKVLARALEVHKDEPALAAHALELDIVMGAFDAALAIVETLQKSSPLPETWMARKAAILSQAGRPDESRVAWLALQTHIVGLPNLKRGSDAIHAIDQMAQRALATADFTTTNTHASAPPAAP